MEDVWSGSEVQKGGNPRFAFILHAGDEHLYQPF